MGVRHSSGHLHANMTAAIRHLPWPATVLMFTLLVPFEATILVGPLRFFAYRIVLLLAFIPALLQVSARGGGRLRTVDVLITLHVAWVCLSFGLVHGPGQALESGGIYAIETLGAYLVARTCIRDARSFRAFGLLLAAIAIGLMALTVPETLTGKPLVRVFFGNIFGHAYYGYGIRSGLLRASGPFPHPILYGVFCSSALGLSWYLLKPHSLLKRMLIALLIICSSMLSLSAGAMIAIAVQLLLICWDCSLGRMRYKWTCLALVLVLGYAGLEVLSRAPLMHHILSHLTFDKTTAFHRLYIWEYGTDVVRQHPFFGIGYSDWAWARPEWMRPSVDNFWLLVAMRHGLPAVALLAAGILSIMVGLMRRPQGSTASLAKGWLVSIAGLLVAGATVHLWDQLLVLLFFALGASVWMLEAQKRHAEMACRSTADTRRAACIL